MTSLIVRSLGAFPPVRELRKSMPFVTVFSLRPKLMTPKNIGRIPTNPTTPTTPPGHAGTAGHEDESDEIPHPKAGKTKRS